MPRYCLLPGDPARFRGSRRGSTALRRPSAKMEFLGFRGTVGGVPIGVCSTGIGGPSASIALEELASVGVDTFIRVGSAGGRQEAIPVGSLVVTAAHRGEGTSLAHLPPRSSPRWPTCGSTTALLDAAGLGGAAVRRHRHHARRLPPEGSGPGGAPQQRGGALTRGDARAASPLEPPSAGTGAGGRRAGDRLEHLPPAEGTGGGAAPLPGGGGADDRGRHQGSAVAGRAGRSEAVYYSLKRRAPWWTAMISTASEPSR
jgi:hypothetical protein